MLTQVSQGHSINISINIEGANSGAGQQMQAKPAAIAEYMVPNPESKTPSGFESKGSDITNIPSHPLSS